MTTRGTGMSNLLWLIEGVIVIAAAVIIVGAVIKYLDTFSDDRWGK